MTNSLHMSRRRRGHGSRAPLLPQVVLMSSYLFALKTERYLVAGVTVCTVCVWVVRPSRDEEWRVRGHREVSVAGKVTAVELEGSEAVIRCTRS